MARIFSNREQRRSQNYQSINCNLTNCETPTTIVSKEGSAMIEFSFQQAHKISEQRIAEMYREAAGNAAAHQVGAGGSAKRIARWLRSAASRIEGDVAGSANQPQVSQLRSLAR